MKEAHAIAHRGVGAATEVNELQTFVNDHRNEQLKSLFNAELSNVVAVDSAVTNRGSNKGEHVYGLAAYPGHSET